MLGNKGVLQLSSASVTSFHGDLVLSLNTWCLTKFFFYCACCLLILLKSINYNKIITMHTKIKTSLPSLSHQKKVWGLMNLKIVIAK